MYLGPQGGAPGSRHSALFAAAGTGSGRGHFGRPPGGSIHSRLVDDSSISSPGSDRYGTRNGTANSSSAFATSPSKGIPITGRGRFEDPARVDRWDSRKGSQGNLQSSPTEPNRDTGGSWIQVAPRRGPSSSSGDWRARDQPAGTNQRAPSIDGGPRPGTAGTSWGREERVVQSGPGSGPKDSSSSSAAARWGRDNDKDDWRARKQAGAAPEPRYDWTDRVPGTGAPGGGNGSAPGGRGKGGNGVPEWAEEGSGSGVPMTAADMEAERQRMQAEWRRARAPAPQGEETTFVDDLVDDDEIERWKKEQEEEERKEAVRVAGQAQSPAGPVHGQHVDMKALFGAGGGAVNRPSAAEETHKMHSRFANVFSLEDSPNPTPAAVLPGQQAQQQPGDAGKTLLAMLQKTGADQQYLGQAESVATDIALGGLDDGPPPQHAQQQQQRPQPGQMQPPPGMGNFGDMAALLGQAQAQQAQQQQQMYRQGGGLPQMPPPQHQGPPPLNFPPGMRPPPGAAPPGPPGMGMNMCNNINHPGNMNNSHHGLGQFPPGGPTGGGGLPRPPPPGMFPPGPGMPPPQMQYRPPGMAGGALPPGVGGGGLNLGQQPGVGQQQGGGGGGHPNPLLAQLLANAARQQQQQQAQQQQQQAQQMQQAQQQHQAQHQAQQQAQQYLQMQQQMQYQQQQQMQMPPQQQQQQVDLAALLAGAGMRAPPQNMQPQQAQQQGYPGQFQARPPAAQYTPQQWAQIQALQARGNMGNMAAPQPQQQTPAQLMAMLGIRPPS